MGVIAAAGIGAATTVGVSMYNNGQADKRAAAAQGNLSSIFGRGDDWLAAAFGDKLNPEAFLYEPVDLTQSQLDTISGNLQAFPSARRLVNKVNPEIWKNDINRISTLMPGFGQARDSYIGTTRRLQEGQLPFSDVMDIVSNSSSISAFTGTPGGGRSMTLRDLGVSRMSAMESGNSMFAQFMNIAQAISPAEHQMRPQQMFFTPQERAQMDIQQRILETQGEGAAEMARAMPNPAMNAMANAEIGLNMAGGGGGGGGGGSGASIAAIAQAAGSLATAYGQSRGSGGGWFGSGGNQTQPQQGYQTPSYNTQGMEPGVVVQQSPYSDFNSNQYLGYDFNSGYGGGGADGLNYDIMGSNDGFYNPY